MTSNSATIWSTHGEGGGGEIILGFLGLTGERAVIGTRKYSAEEGTPQQRVPFGKGHI